MSLAGTLILVSEFCERFTFYGIKTVLVLYFLSRLDCDKDESTILFHIFLMLVSIFSLVGAVVADRWWGLFQTIYYLSLAYAIGAVILTLGTVVTYDLSIWQTTLVGLGLIAVGTGGLKPCVSAFGKDQFELPKQSVELTGFFSLFYYSVCTGSILSTIITPVLRGDYYCYGDRDCFSLPFALTAIMMINATVAFIAGKEQYIKKPPAANLMFGVTQCIISAFDGWKIDREIRPRKHLLDYAAPREGQKMVSDTKILLKILLLYIPLSFFWALYDQQGSRWTLQAIRMDGELWGYTIKPDQMQLSNQLLILLLVPIFNNIIYPFLTLCNIRRPLQKISIGGLLAALAFVFAADLEKKLDAFEPFSLHNTTISQLRIYNAMDCPFFETLPFTSVGFSTSFVYPLQMWEATFKTKDNETSLFEFDIRAVEERNLFHCAPLKNEIEPTIPGKAISYVYADGKRHKFEEQLERDKSGNAIVTPLINIKPSEGDLFLKDSANYETYIYPFTNEPIAVISGNFTLFLDDLPLTTITTERGGVYVLLGQGSRKKGFKFQTYVTIEPYSVHIMWQLPQYVLITAAEVMFTISVLEFTFTEAPKTIKSVLQVYWLVTNALGNLLVVVIVKLKFTKTQRDEYMLFAYIMLIDMLIFIILTKYIINVGQENVRENRRPSAATPRLLPTRSSLIAAPRPRPSISSPSQSSLPDRTNPISSSRPGLSTT